MNWTKEAEAALEKVPFFVRPMARRAVEEYCKKNGIGTITEAEVKAAREKFLAGVDEEPQPDAVKPTKVAIVRCDIVSETCPGVGCMNAWNRRKVHFEQYGTEAELIGVFTCGGCSGRRVYRLVKKLKDYGLDVVHLSSCMLMDGDYPRCPFKQIIKEGILGQGVKVVEGTHH